MTTTAPHQRPKQVIAFQAGYQLDPETPVVAMLEDAYCLLESAASLANEAGCNANGPIASGCMFGIWQLISLAKDLVEEACSATLKAENCQQREVHDHG